MIKNIIIICILSFTLMCAGCTENGGIQEVKSASSTEIATVEATTTQLPQKGTYENPAEVGEAIVLSSLGETYEFSVIDVIRGVQANNVIASENMFNDEPPNDYEYVLVNVQLKYTDGSDATSVSSWDFQAFSEGVELESGFVVIPDNYKEFTMGDLMPGATKTGWLVYTVPQNKEVIISYKPNMFISNACYISIGQ